MAKTTSKNPQVGKITDEEERKKALSNTLGAIEKQFGKGAIMKLGEKTAMNVQTIPSGCLELDIALGVGGVPRGRIIEIYGPESSGKTTVALHMVAQAQKMGGTAAFIDAEHALDPVYAKALGVDIVFNHADYRLMSKRAVEGLAEFTEVNLFLRGIVPQIGYKWTTVTYERAERFAGESKYPLKKMIAFAADGITSFSVKPIRLVFSTGVVVFIISLLMLLYALIAKIAGHTSVGWTSLMGSIWLIGGIQLLGLGVVGEYIGKIYNETKRRPRFIIESVLNKADNE